MFDFDVMMDESVEFVDGVIMEVVIFVVVGIKVVFVVDGKKVCCWIFERGM